MHTPLPTDRSLYDTDCPILFAMRLIGQKWKLPILWYISEGPDETLRYGDLLRKAIGITPTMLTKCLRELEGDRLLFRQQYNTIPPKVEYSLTDSSRALLPALSMLYDWAQMEMSKLDPARDTASAGSSSRVD